MYHLEVSRDCSVPSSHLAFNASLANLLVAGLNTVAILSPTFGFLLVVGYLVTNCDKVFCIFGRMCCLFSNFVPPLGTYSLVGLTHPCRRNFRHFLL